MAFRRTNQNYQTGNTMPYPIKKLIQETRMDPKPAVPQDILDQYPWHWDPMKKDHEDYKAYVGNVKFDWQALGDWAVKRSNEHRVPHRYWYLDEDTGIIHHGDENCNENPIYEQARQHFEYNNYNEHNTQYFKWANETLEEWEPKLTNLFPDLKYSGISLFVQMPGQTIPSHADTYSSYMRRVGSYPDYSKVVRYIIFVRDWDFGHFFHWGNECINQWKAGDLWFAQKGVYHGSANAGIMPKLTIHWSGEYEGSYEDQWKHLEFNSKSPWWNEGRT